ncbi:DinB family protein [Chitinophaga sp. 212800010-3]|uniref:DinB family protein n=1 Tax=unclassified Chitinophaga TaxID=2619133 RepID=UPI002DF4EBC9|nr:DinB-2 domain-containing protein [Chitinophaga sp. 212800010-3]
MENTATIRLAWLLENIPTVLGQLNEEEWRFKPSPEKWSKQEILGHLIDSAANNHQRFVRIQVEDEPVIRYNQNDWNKYSRHQLQPATLLLDTWTTYNRFLLSLIKHIPEAALTQTGIGGEGKPFTLAFIIDDYVAHMEHHLRQIINY